MELAQRWCSVLGRGDVVSGALTLLWGCDWDLDRHRTLLWAIPFLVLLTPSRPVSPPWPWTRESACVYGNGGLSGTALHDQEPPPWLDAEMETGTTTDLLEKSISPASRSLVKSPLFLHLPSRKPYEKLDQWREILFISTWKVQTLR